MADETGKAATFWDREIIEQSHISWMADPSVRRYINSATDDLWPMDWLGLFLGKRRFGRALSIGCGTGGLERDLVRRGICDRIDAFDGSVHSLWVARREAEAMGASERIRYFAMDFNEPDLPRNTYDAVFFHQSFHHVAKLEKLCRAVLLALSPRGMLYIDEYIGPSRFDWSDELIGPQREVFGRLPPAARASEQLPLPIQMDDPSEAFRSSEILPQLAIGFDTLERRDYGGNVLSVLFPAIRWQEAPPDLVETLIREERGLLSAGAESFHAVVVLTPKRGLAKALASGRYFLAPKLRRLQRELAARLRG